MIQVRSIVPETQSLAAALAVVFSAHEGESRPVAILQREDNVFTSTFPSEIVTIALEGGATRRIFCKYGAGHEDPVYGHKSGVAYEAKVYESVLAGLDLSLPEYFGSFTAAQGGATWLFLELFSEQDRMRMQPDLPGTLAMAAEWIGRFHAHFEGRTQTEPLRFLNRYDLTYYEGWMRRTLELSIPLHARFPWLAALCSRGEEAFAPLLDGVPTILHGELYPCNILARPTAIYPVDWESAAVGAGEIDLASLIECWSPEIQARAIAAYRQVRWPNGAPPDFARRIEAARLYMQFRWLGDRQEWTLGRGSIGRLRQLYRAGRRLRLI